MLSATEDAIEFLAQVLDQQHAAEGVSLRLVVDEDGEMELGLDLERPDDFAVQHDGRIVLLIGKDVAERVAGDLLDVEEGQLVLRPSEG